MPGRLPVQKVRDSLVLPLPMWVTALNPDGTEDTSKDGEAKLWENWEYVLSLFDVDGQFPLVKRVYNTAGDIIAATANAELVETPDPRVIAANTFGFTVELDLADPYFYSAVAPQAIGTIDVEGNAPTDRLVITMGPGRFTGADGNWVQYNGTGTVTIDVHARSAKVGDTYVNGLITRNLKFPGWPTLKPGSNALTGAGTIQYSAAYK
jgi:hypothetical protein